MKHTLTTLIASFLLLGLAVTPASAQGKIGTVKLRTLFDGYYKTKLADAKIKERAAELDKDMESLTGRYKALEVEQQEAAAAAADLAVSKDELDRRRVRAEQKAVELKAMETEIVKFRRTAETSLREQQNRMRARVLEEIQAEIDLQAKAGGYFLILNKEGEDRNETPLIMYHNGEHDLTDTVLAKLNASAPATLETTSNDPPGATTGQR